MGNRVNKNKLFSKVSKIVFIIVIFTIYFNGIKAQTASTFCAGFNEVSTMIYDKSGNLYTANAGNNTIGKITPNGIAYTYARGLNTPIGMAFDKTGNLFVVNSGGNTISKISPAGVISTFIDTTAGLHNPRGMAIDKNGNMYVSTDVPDDVTFRLKHCNIIKITPNGIVSVFCDGYAHSSSSYGFEGTVGLAFDIMGNLYATSADYVYSISSVQPYNYTETIYQIKPDGSFTNYADTQYATYSSSSYYDYVIGGICFDKSGNLIVASMFTSRVNMVLPNGHFSPLAVDVSSPYAVAFDPSGSLFVSSKTNNQVQRIGPYRYTDSTIKNLYCPRSIAFDYTGNLFVTSGSKNNEQNPGVINKIDSNGVISPFLKAGLIDLNVYSPNSVAIDKANNLYVLCFSGIKKVSSDGNISNFIDTGNGFQSPAELVIDKTGNLFVVNNGGINKILPNGIMTTFVAANTFKSPAGLAIDANNNIYLIDNSDDFRIYKILSDGSITYYTSPERLWGPIGITVDSLGNIYIGTSEGSGVEYYSPKDSSMNVLVTYNPYFNITSFALASSGNMFVSYYEGRIMEISLSTILPVSLTSFTAQNLINESIQLNWGGFHEINSSYYTIQHSTDGISYSDIGTVKALGCGANSYKFIDNNPANGTNYYRLQSVDKDGSSSCSKIVTLTITNYQLPITVSPNPAKDFATISFSKSIDKGTIAVYDITGKQVISQLLSGNANAYKLNTQTLKSGVYVVKVKSGAESYTEKLLIHK